MKNIFTVLIVFLYIHSSSAGVLSFCKTVFSEKKYFNYMDIKNPLSHILISTHLTAQSEKWFVNKKQIKMSEQGLRETLEFLEHSHADRPANLNVPLENLIQKTSEIMEFVKHIPAEEALPFRKTVLAVLSLFNKHIPVLLKEDPGRMDWHRVNLIVKQIADFDPQSPRFSLYKIKRAIEGRYSLREFVLCRT